MSIYLISYDLGVPETSADYQKIKGYIDTFPDWMKPLKSQWFITSRIKDATQIRTELGAITDGNDKILVLNVTGDAWASLHLGTEANDWLKKNL